MSVLVNRVTNPRGRPADTSADADPLAARQALLDAVAAYTDAPVQWSASAPVTDEVLPYAKNLEQDPRFTASSGRSSLISTLPWGAWEDGSGVRVESVSATGSPSRGGLQ